MTNNILYYLEKIKDNTITLQELIYLKNNGICVICKDGIIKGFTK